MEKNYKKTNIKPVIYTMFYEILRNVAIDHGYNLVMHGSMVRDLDLIAIPWVEDIKPHEAMLKAMGEILGCIYDDLELRRPDNAHKNPHGRLSYTLTMGGEYWMDISIMPCIFEYEREKKSYCNISHGLFVKATDSYCKGSVDEWLDMASAPLDGTPVLLLNGEFIVTGRFKDGAWRALHYGQREPYYSYAEVIGWQPLPKAKKKIPLDKPLKQSPTK